jgi:cysteine desulfurase/selenocysteine lyase
MTLAYEAAPHHRRFHRRARGRDRLHPRRDRGDQSGRAKLGRGQSQAGDRILLSTLEHHSNIVPWQILRERAGFEIDVCPLTEDGRSIWMPPARC